MMTRPQFSIPQRDCPHSGQWKHMTSSKGHGSVVVSGPCQPHVHFKKAFPHCGQCLNSLGPTISASGQRVVSFSVPSQPQSHSRSTCGLCSPIQRALFRRTCFAVVTYVVPFNSRCLFMAHLPPRCHPDGTGTRKSFGTGTDGDARLASRPARSQDTSHADAPQTYGSSSC